MELSRRSFLAFLGAAGGAVVLDPNVVLARGGPQSFSDLPDATGSILPGGDVTPVRLPHQLAAYGSGRSFLPTGIGAGTVGRFPGKLAAYTVIDDVVVPPEFERYVIIAWGDRVYPNPEEYFGYNFDYTHFVSTNGKHE